MGEKGFIRMQGYHYGVHGVASSNLAVPTNEINDLQILLISLLLIF
jgi:hypothetical protein